MRLSHSVPLLALAVASCGAPSQFEPVQLVRAFSVEPNSANDGGGELTGTVAARSEATLSFRER